MREFLYADDLAEACVHLMRNYSAQDLGEFVNIGAGEDLSIRELARITAGVVGYDGEVRWDPEKPDGMMRKVLDVSKIHALGWKARTSLMQGIQNTYDWYRIHGVS
jgi:GDP-L-fucose synthase